MGVPSIRSPSPVSSRPNSNSKTPEISSSIRRSFKGNPFSSSFLPHPRTSIPPAPANSPADLGRRNSLGKGGLASFPDYEQKENGKDQIMKPVKGSSPSLSKGAKNFMSPTISAASKIAPSPKKKVLGERNEPVRTSSSSVEGKSPLIFVNASDTEEDTVSKTDRDFNQTDPLSSDLKGFKRDRSLEASKAEVNKTIESKPDCHISSKLTQTLSEPVSAESNGVNDDDSSFKIKSTSLSSSIMAPLDADPSIPPYDPKTNYLSPRPQFLYYRPNPRIQIYLKNKGLSYGERTELEETFSTESSSVFGNSEETSSEELLEDTEDNSSSVEIVSEEEEEPIVEPKRVNKPYYYSKSKSVSLIFVLFLACLSCTVIDSPVIGPFVPKEQSYAKLCDVSELSEYAKVNIDLVTRNFKLWSTNSLSYFSKLVHILNEAGRSNPSLPFSNFTSFHEEVLSHGYIRNVNDHKIEAETCDPDEFSFVMEPKIDLYPTEEEGFMATDNGQEICEETKPDIDEVSEEHAENVLNFGGIEAVHIQDKTEHPDFEVPQIKDVETQKSEAEETKPETDVVSEEHAEDVLKFGDVEALHIQEKAEDADFEVVQINEDKEIEKPEEEEEAKAETDVLSAEDVVDFGDLEAAVHIQHKAEDADFEGGQIKEEVETEKSEAEEILDTSNEALKDQSVRNSEVNFEISEMDTSHLKLHSEERASEVGTNDKFLKRIITVLLVIILMASPVFLLCPKKEKSSPDRKQLTKKFVSGCQVEKLSSKNLPTEVDMMGESCPSEMSSFGNSSYSKRALGVLNDEAQSNERKTKKYKKRESLASSSEYSMGSPSYGSFTTYEKIPTKHVSGGEETITPVRRSSRIRHQVTSPE